MIDDDSISGKDILCEKCGGIAKSHFFGGNIGTPKEDDPLGIYGTTADFCCNIMKCEKCGHEFFTDETKKWIDKMQKEIDKLNNK